MIEPIRDGILFVFIDNIKGKFFKESTNWGFDIIGDSDNSASSGRWGKIVALGPDVNAQNITKDDYIFIEPLMWTEGLMHDGVKIWKTDESKVMATSKELMV